MAYFLSGAYTQAGVVLSNHPGHCLHWHGAGHGNDQSLEQKREYVLEHKADILVMGDDWQGKFDYLNDICQVVYLPRTPSVSTTAIIEHIVGNS